MKLYHLVDSINIQSNIEIRQLGEDGETIDTMWFDCCEGLRKADLGKMKNLSVKYIYSQTFKRNYWNHSDTCAYLVIEVEGGTK